MGKLEPLPCPFCLLITDALRRSRQRTGGGRKGGQHALRRGLAGSSALACLEQNEESQGMRVEGAYKGHLKLYQIALLNF